MLWQTAAYTVCVQFCASSNTEVKKNTTENLERKEKLNKHEAFKKAGFQINTLLSLNGGMSSKQQKKLYCISLLSSSSLAVYLFSKLLLTSAISHGKKLFSISGNRKYDKGLNTHIIIFMYSAEYQ